MSEMNFKNRGEQVFETLKREILDLKLEPGRMISENEICERFGVSRTPVRDALRLLQEQGFVETVPYRGTYVTLLSLDNIKQMIYMRVAVETMVLRDFLKVQNPMTLEEIRHAIAMQKALIQTPGFEPEQFYHMDAELHSIWFGAVRRNCGICFRHSSFIIPVSGCWILQQRPILPGSQESMKKFSA